ncbi:unnamed protein product [Angiostrongylus costaricensis]|uniref:FLYWCH-type domain-containing protein n=1 Tax=Angiostrongylus costaricensis TaxID=334426 RepID=A0A0R3PRB5_ANGCS|nr:unnamed protein product [Angiostrongylus costaricensis]
MNLPDLLSRVISFTNGSKMYLCFSKRCRKQLCFEGHLYNIDGFVKPTNWNLWRCANPSCSGAIRTSPNITELRVREPHSHLCRPEDIQIRLRITVYDLRLMAEFTDLPLDVLYHAYLDKVMDEHTDIVHLFPSFETLKANLEEHRNHLVCLYSMIPTHTTTFNHSEHITTYLRFRHKISFLSTYFSITTGKLLSQIDSPLMIQACSKYNIVLFYLVNLWQWIRELQYHSKYRLKKMCLHDEHMYYLCQNDVRHFKSNHIRSAIPDMHCTAFVRVHDWRLIIQREVNEVVVDYCLEHIFHNGMCLFVGCCVFFIMVFIRDLEARRERTQQLIQDKGLQRIKRRNQAPSICKLILNM